MAAEIDIQLFKKLRYAHLSAFTRIRVNVTVNEIGGGGASKVVKSAIHTVPTNAGETDYDGEMVTVPYASYYISKVEVVLKELEPPVPVGSLEIEIHGTTTTQIANLVVLTGTSGSAVTAFDGEVDAAVIGGSCWLQG